MGICLPAKPVIVLNGDRPPARGMAWQRTFRGPGRQMGLAAHFSWAGPGLGVFAGFQHRSHGAPWGPVGPCGARGTRGTCAVLCLFPFENRVIVGKV